MWVTNGLRSGPRVRADEDRPRRRPAAQGHDLLHRREGAGRIQNRGSPSRPRSKKMGLQGRRVDGARLRRLHTARPNDLGGEEAGLGKGFVQMIDALEVGRVNVAARGVGIAQRALELGLRCARRRSLRRTIASTRRSGSSSPTWRPGRGRAPADAQGRAPEGRRRASTSSRHRRSCASETGKEGRRSPSRLHGGYGCSKEYESSELYRDAPLFLISEGTSEKSSASSIGKKLLQRHQIERRADRLATTAADPRRRRAARRRPAGVAGRRRACACPSLVLFLGVGMLIGSDGLGWIDFDDYELARTIGIVALALILFEGGLDRRLRRDPPGAARRRSASRSSARSSPR